MACLMRLLAFDSSTDTLSIALAGPDGLREREHPGGAMASARLIGDIMALLSDAGMTFQDLDAIAFGRGPGAFTGLRTACAVAQGLAFGADKPVIGIDTLLAVAEDAVMRAGGQATPRWPSVWAVLDARMGEIYAAHYRHLPSEESAAPEAERGHWEILVAPFLTTPEALVDRWRVSPPAVVAGPALAVYADALLADGLLDGAAHCLDAMPRARALVRLAERAWAAGESADAARALPLYVRDKVAQTTEERDVARQVKASARPAAAPSLRLTPEPQE